MKNKKTLMAYFAGYFDGEGSVSIKRFKRSSGGRVQHGLWVSIGSSNNLPLFEACRHFGGSLKCYKLKGNRRPIWIFTMTGRVALCFLKEIYPYCLIKRRPIELAFEFRSKIRKKRLGSKPLTDNEITERQELKELLETVNKNNFTGPN
jgi:hypothetical protein